MPSSLASSQEVPPAPGGPCVHASGPVPGPSAILYLSCFGAGGQATLPSCCAWAALVLCLGLFLPPAPSREVGNLSWLLVSCAQEFNVSSPSRAAPICLGW